MRLPRFSDEVVTQINFK